MRMAELRTVLNRLPTWRGARYAEALTELHASSPDCPLLRYLLGCHFLDLGRPATAVEHFMTAYHRQSQLESASLLVFAGLNWISSRDRPLLPVLLETCGEVRHPTFDRTPLERALLDRFAETPPASAGASGSLHRLPLKTLRAQLCGSSSVASGGGESLLAAQ